MVQRKAPHRLAPQTTSKKEPVRHQSNLSSYQQQGSRNKASESEQVRFKLQPAMHERPSAIKDSDQLPNYMKPTSSSDARKEQYKVTSLSPADSGRIRSPRNSSALNCSRPSTSSPDGSGLKDGKVLKRKPGLKQVRPWMRRGLGIALCPKLNASRATCSSTLKDSKFPKALDLNPGGTEADGTSVLKVCPYTYCSLNGHGHEPLPPLKCFLSSRRKLLRTQKSMKLKGVSPFRKKGLGRDEKEGGTGQAVITRAPSALEILMEEVANDFFVEIYAKPPKQIIESGNCNETSPQVKDDKEIPAVLGNLEPAKDDGECSKSKEDDGRNVVDGIHESNSVVSFEDGADQNSDVSIEEMDVMINFLEYVSCDEQDGDEEGNSTCSVRKDDAELSSECQVVDGLVRDSEDLADGVIKVPCEASEMNLEGDVDQFPDNKSDCSENADGLGPLFRHLFEDDDPKESSAINSVSCDGTVQDQRTGSPTSNPPEAESLKENDLGDPPSSEENDSSLSFLGHLEASKGPEEGRETKHNFPGLDGEGEGSEAVKLEANLILHHGSAEQAVLSSNGISKEDNRNEEVVEAISSSDVHLSDSNEGFAAKGCDATEADHIQTDMEIKACKCDETTEELSILVKIQISFNDPSDEVGTGNNREKSGKEHQEEVNEMGGMSRSTEQDCSETDDLETCLTAGMEGPELSSQPPAEASGEPKPKMSIVRKKRTEEEEEQMKEFNPREPNFLPVEPDPEAEKVDLRHQEVDERKNAEEWMIDYALQQAVTKLAPARKRKVALLVEAFETVMPMPMCDQAVQHANQGFDHARTIQACS